MAIWSQFSHLSTNMPNKPISMKQSILEASTMDIAMRALFYIVVTRANIINCFNLNYTIYTARYR